MVGTASAELEVGVGLANPMAIPTRRLHIDLVGGLPLYQPAQLRPVLERFVQHDRLRPATWGLDERGGKPAELEAMARVADGQPSTRLLQLKGKKSPSFEAFVSVGDQPRVAVRLASRDVSRDGPMCVRFADALADVFQPDVGWVHAFFDNDPPLNDARSLAWWTMDQLVDGRIGGYGRSGPGGLAMVTYLAPRWADRLGAKLGKVPGLQCEALAWGGVRVSLCDAVFDAPDERLADLWSQAMASVEDEQVFAARRIRPDGATSFTRSPGFTWPTGYRP